MDVTYDVFSIRLVVPVVSVSAVLVSVVPVASAFASVELFGPYVASLVSLILPGAGESGEVFGGVTTTMGSLEPVESAGRSSTMVNLLIEFRVRSDRRSCLSPMLFVGSEATVDRASSIVS